MKITNESFTLTSSKDTLCIFKIKFQTISERESFSFVSQINVQKNALFRLQNAYKTKNRQKSVESITYSKARSHSFLVANVHRNSKLNYLTFSLYDYTIMSNRLRVFVTVFCTGRDKTTST